MSTIAVFGGSFSPVHRGHMEVAANILRLSLADKVIMMPCRRNPLKDGTSLMPDQDRIRLLEAAASYYRNVKDSYGILISEMELNMPAPSYTYKTLELLSVENPKDRFRLVVGSDSYLDFDRWKNGDWIENNFSPIVYPRPGYRIDMLRPNWTVLEDVEQIDLSSSAIREMIRHGDDLKTLRHLMPWIENNELLWKIKKN